MNSKKGFPCPCCGYLTLEEPANNTFSICPVCSWEDDELQNRNPNLVGGANEESLNEARRNFKEFKASAQRFIGEVRPPFPEEIPDLNHEKN